MKGSLAERFWDKLPKSRSKKLCWSWLGTRNRGYGTIRLGKKWVKATRVCWEIHFGLIPNGLNVLHKCDNPACCNPGHLFIGTQLDNVHDMIAKGRRADLSKDRHGRAKLTSASVQTIRNELKRGIRGAILARRFNVSKSTISGIKTNETWS